MEKTGVSMEEAVPILKLLGDRTRLSIVLMLYERECCVCEIVDVLSMSQPAISQHLRKLRDAKIVAEDRRGQWIYYRLRREASFHPLVENIVDSIPVQETLHQKMNAAKKLNQC
ncbi:ArsR/SmtB family transcription factor [Lentibacillus amyloliquefaciens]|uniref:ArsR family transcriptional regulator n=1 Tax=Lentibacillus amyloliquefaciens TaxID=1472767 RepID=A0A0U4F8N9_9BACI|nr:metalloregulator ArsR/SmtB family transcription factor [Lentibacillus amyloliquefaciens]ALX49171.1 ArsR family transcriptional regulator [Lentibacillus amyloliquefaciens]